MSFFIMDELRFIQKCVNKDKESWDEFVGRYSRLIYNYIYAVLRAKGYTPTADNAGDIYQGIFLSLVQDNCKKLRSFKARNKCSLASWLRIITINFTLDFLRRSRHLNISLDEDTDRENGTTLKDAIADEDAGAEEVVLGKEKIEQLTECLSQLDTRDKYFVQMHIYQGLDMEGLARLFKASRGALDVLKGRIIEKLKECFRKKKFMLD